MSAPTQEQIEMAFAACRSIRFAMANAARNGCEFNLNDIEAADRLASWALGADAVIVPHECTRLPDLRLRCRHEQRGDGAGSFRNARARAEGKEVKTGIRKYVKWYRCRLVIERGKWELGLTIDPLAPMVGFAVVTSRCYQVNLVFVAIDVTRLHFVPAF